MGPSIIEKLIPREKPKLLSLTNQEKQQASTATISPDSIEASTASSSSAAPTSTTTPAPPGSALKALFGKKIKPLPPPNLQLPIDKNDIIEEKTKISPASNTDLDEDSSDIKTPPMSPRSPVTQKPTTLELKLPPTSTKPLSSNYINFYLLISYIYLFLASQANDIAKRTQYYQVSTSTN